MVPCVMMVHECFINLLREILSKLLMKLRVFEGCLGATQGLSPISPLTPPTFLPFTCRCRVPHYFLDKGVVGSVSLLKTKILKSEV